MAIFGQAGRIDERDGASGHGLRRPKGNAAVADLPSGKIIQDDCVAAMARCPTPRSTWSSPIRPTIFSPAQSVPARGQPVDAVDDDWDKFDTFATYDAFTRA